MVACNLFDHPVAEDQEKPDFAKPIQGFFLASSEVWLFFCAFLSIGGSLVVTLLTVQTEEKTQTYCN